MKKIRHVGWRVERCRHGLLERIFAEEWIKENEERAGVNGGLGILSNLFRRDWSFKIWPNRRDAFVAATVIQWLGTNCGFSFLNACLRKCGYEIQEVKHIENDYYWKDLRTHPFFNFGGFLGMFKFPGAWHNFAASPSEPKVSDNPLLISSKAKEKRKAYEEKKKGGLNGH